MMGVAEKKWPGSEAEQDFAKYLVANHGAHFVTVVRRGAGRLLGVSIPRQTIVVKELMDSASSSTLESLQRENGALRGAQTYTYIGRDGKSVLARDLEDRAEAAEAEVKRLRGALEGISNPKIVQSFGDPGVLRDAARTALASTGGEDHAE